MAAPDIDDVMRMPEPVVSLPTFYRAAHSPLRGTALHSND